MPVPIGGSDSGSESDVIFLGATDVGERYVTCNLGEGEACIDIVVYGY